MTDIRALREAAEKAKAARSYFIRKQSRDAEIAYDKADEDFRDEANPAAIIAILDRLKEAEEVLKETRDTLMNLQPHMHSTRQQAGPFCAAAQIVDDEISRAMKQASAHLERHNNE